MHLRDSSPISRHAQLKTFRAELTFSAHVNVGLCNLTFKQLSWASVEVSTCYLPVNCNNGIDLKIQVNRAVILSRVCNV